MVPEVRWRQCVNCQRWRVLEPRKGERFDERAHFICSKHPNAGKRRLGCRDADDTVPRRPPELREVQRAVSKVGAKRGRKPGGKRGEGSRRGTRKVPRRSNGGAGNESSGVGGMVLWRLVQTVVELTQNWNRLEEVAAMGPAGIAAMSRRDLVAEVVAARQFAGLPELPMSEESGDEGAGGEASEGEGVEEMSCGKEAASEDRSERGSGSRGSGERPSCRETARGGRSERVLADRVAGDVPSGREPMGAFRSEGSRGVRVGGEGTSCQEATSDGQSDGVRGDRAAGAVPTCRDVWIGGEGESRGARRAASGDDEADAPSERYVRKPGADQCRAHDPAVQSSQRAIARLDCGLMYASDGCPDGQVGREPEKQPGGGLDVSDADVESFCGDSTASSDGGEASCGECDSA